MMIAAPSPFISMAFCTGSVVVPRVSETIDVSCPVIRLTRVDLPALQRPSMAICVRSIVLVDYCFIIGPFQVL